VHAGNGIAAAGLQFDSVVTVGPYRQREEVCMLVIGPTSCSVGGGGGGVLRPPVMTLVLLAQGYSRKHTCTVTAVNEQALCCKHLVLSVCLRALVDLAC
jgi:hypothetical protein